MNRTVVGRPSSHLGVAAGLILLAALIGAGLLWALPGKAEAQNNRSPKIVYGVTASNKLITFVRGRPENLTRIGNIQGLAQGEKIVGIDFRPANNRLYAIGDTSQLYIINIARNQANPVGGPIDPALTGRAFGIDFNPTVDLIRLVSNDGQNLRISPVTGQVTSADPDLAFAASDPNENATPNVVGAGYTNNNADAQSTALFDIDSNLDVLVRQNPANAGTLTTVGPLGVDTNHLVGFDIAAGYGALAALRPVNNGRSQLYTVNVGTGETNRLGRIGKGISVVDIAIPLPQP